MKKINLQILILLLIANAIFSQEVTKEQNKITPADSAKETVFKIDSAKVFTGAKIPFRDTVFIKHAETPEPKVESQKPISEKIINTAVQREQRVVDIIKAIDIYSIIEILLLVLIASGLFKLINRFARNKWGRKYSKLALPISAFVKILIVIAVVVLSITLLFGSSKEITFALLILFLIFTGAASIPVIKNLIGGFSIRYNSLFEKGDFIKIDSFEGRVSKLGWRSTSLVTDDESTIHIPNSLFFEKPVENINTGQVEHLVTYRLILTQDLDPLKIIPLLKEIAVSNPYTFQKKQTDVYLKEIDLIKKVNCFEINFYIFDRQFESEAVAQLNESVLSTLKTHSIVD